MGSVLDFGAKGDGISDDTIAIQHAVEKSGGDILFPKGSYLITKPIRVMLGNTGPHGFRSEGGTARVLMKGAGPAFQIIGTHQKSALPEHISNSLWLKERMPLFQDLEITGDHPEAAGVGNRADEVAVRHPSHRAGHDGMAAAEEVAATLG